MSIKLSNKDYIWSMVGTICSLGAYVIMEPFALYYLDDDMYGLYEIFQSLVQITVLFDFGFSTTFARNINYCWCGAKELKKTGAVFAEGTGPNFWLMKNTMEACRRVFFIISLAAFVLLASVGSFYILYVCRTIEGPVPMIAWLFYLTAIFLNLYYGYYNSFLRGVGAISYVNKATVFARGAQLIFTIIFLACGLGIIGMGVAYLAYGIVFRLLGRKYFYRFQQIGIHLNAIKEKVSAVTVRELFRVVWHNASREGIVTLSNYLANQASTLLCSLFLPLSVTGMYSLSVLLATAVSNVSGILYNANQPVLHSAYISNDRLKMKKTMSLILISYISIFIVGVLGVVFVGLPVVRLIRPGAELTVAMILGTSVYQFILKFRNCYTSYFSCTNRLPYVKAFILSSIGSVMMSYCVLRFTQWEIWGLIIVQILSQGCYNGWVWALRAHREMELSVPQTVQYGWEELLKIVKIKGVKKHGA